MSTGDADDRDPLTGLGRTGTFQQQLDARCHPEGPSFIVGLVDVEGLRHINREYGSDAGDSLLCQVADRLSSCGLVDVVARVGGDEFGLLADGVDPDEGGQWLRRIRLRALSDPFSLGGTARRVNFRLTRRAGPPLPGRNLFWEVQRDAFVDGVRELSQIAATYNDVMDENEKLRHLARTDPLTGLLNRRGMHEQLETVGPLAALAFVDLDNLSELNKLDDRWEDGDAAICGLAERLRDGFGAENVGRWGGDEFLVISVNMTPKDMAELLERILGQCRSELIVSGRPITFSAGVSGCEEGPEAARARAEDAVLLAKSSKATVILSS